MKFITNVTAQAHDEFVKQSPLNHLLQSSTWAKVKDNWSSKIVGVTNDDDELIASSLVLIKTLPLGFTMYYAPRGPIMDYHNQDLVSFFFKEFKKFAKKDHALFIKIDPAILVESSEPVISNLKQVGADWLGLTKNMSDTIQPRFNAVIYKEDFSEDNLSKKTRQFLNKAKRSEPIVEIGSISLIPEFCELMRKTEIRKDISLRNAEYYQKLLEQYPQDAFITLTRINLGKLLSNYQADLMKISNDIDKITNNKKLKAVNLEIENIQKNISELSTIIKEHGEVVPASCELCINSGGAAETLYGGTDITFQKYYPSYLTWYETINTAFNKGARTVNMGGVENSLSKDDGLLRFKKHFNPQIEEYIGEFNIPVNGLLYKLSNLAYNRRKHKK